MPLAYPDALSWARSRPADDEPRLAMLESFAFQAYPAVVAGFGSDGAALAAALRQPSSRRTSGAVSALIAVVGIVAAVAPSAGMSILGAESYLHGRLPVDVSVHGAAVAFWVAAAGIAAAIIGWVRLGATWSGMFFGYGALSAICAGFATVSMPRIAERFDYPLHTAPLVPVWVTFALGLLLAALVLIRVRVRAPESDATPIAIDDIPRADLAAILTDRDAALRELAGRGILTPELLQRALAAAPGTLHVFGA